MYLSIQNLQNHVSSQMETLFFDNQITSAGDRLAQGLMILVLGTVSYRKEEQPKIRVSDFIELELSIEKMTGRVEIDIDVERLSDAALERLKGVLGSNPGKAPVSVVVVGREMGDVVLQVPKSRIKPSRDVVTALDAIEGVANVRLVSRTSRGRRLA